MRPRIEVGDTAVIPFDSPPDEFGIVETIYPANAAYHRRALIRFPDGSSTTVAYSRLRLLRKADGSEPES